MAHRGWACYHLFFENLANKLRIEILEVLMNKPRSVSEIAGVLKEERSKVSHALKYLELCGMVTVRNVGKNHIYTAKKKVIVPLFKLVDKHVNITCPGCRKSEYLGRPEALISLESLRQ